MKIFYFFTNFNDVGIFCQHYVSNICLVCVCISILRFVISLFILILKLLFIMNDEFVVALTKKFCIMFHFMILILQSCRVVHVLSHLSKLCRCFCIHWFFVFLIFVKIFNSSKFFFWSIYVLQNGNFFYIIGSYSGVRFFIWYVNFNCVSFCLTDQSSHY